MVRQLLPISALLLGSALLLFAGGMNGLILPVRGSAEGFSAASLGLLGTGWAIGYVAGCYWMPRLVARVGHIRAFAAMAALASVSVLTSLLVLHPGAWIPLRALCGFCFAGAAMIVESWLGERADARSRGRIFGLYTMVNLAASTAGQMALTLGDTGGFVFFVVPAIFYALALVPTAVSATQAPTPLTGVRLDVPALWRNSPIAVVAVFLVGVSNASFGTLSAVYAGEVGLVLVTVALFASLPVLAGALSQIPVGILSDRLDRRLVIVVLAAVALSADLAFILLAPEGRAANLLLSALFGTAVFAMYPVILAHAGDHAGDRSYIQISGGLLIIFGFGSILGPFTAGLAMGTVGPTGLFMTSAAAHTAMILFALLRMAVRAPVPVAEKGSFVAVPPARSATPETAVLAFGDPDAPDDAPDAAPDAAPEDGTEAAEIPAAEAPASRAPAAEEN